MFFSAFIGLSIAAFGNPFNASSVNVTSNTLCFHQGTYLFSVREAFGFRSKFWQNHGCFNAGQFTLWANSPPVFWNKRSEPGFAHAEKAPEAINKILVSFTKCRVLVENSATFNHGQQITLHPRAIQSQQTATKLPTTLHVAEFCSYFINKRRSIFAQVTQSRFALVLPWLNNLAAFVIT